jgi:hypothetical protein
MDKRQHGAKASLRQSVAVLICKIFFSTARKLR